MNIFNLLAFLLAGCLTEGYKILAIFPYQGRSHNLMFEPLVMGLARAGHDVDVVSHFPPPKSIPGFNHISLKGSLFSYVNNVTAASVKDLTSIPVAMKFVSSTLSKYLCNLMGLPQLQNILNTTTKYDVMLTQIFGTNCYMAVAHKLKLPVVGVLTFGMVPWSYDPFFDIENPSYIPTQLSSFSSQMSFVERLQNLFIHYRSKMLFYYYDKTVSEPIARKYVDDLPPLNDLYNNMSIVLVNSHRSIHGVRPMSPAVIEVAGLHIDETQQLSKDLELYLNSSTEGVVYFSMGTMVKSETFSAEKIKAIYASFAELPQYKVLWKGTINEMPEGIPPNVKMVPWIAQSAALRHPNVKAFVTHGGLMGTQEAIHAGVPMIGIPFFADQSFNIAGYTQKGIAVRVNYEDLNKASFSKALREVLTNPKYKSNVERVSRLFKDRPRSPIDEAVYWVEYVIRNGGESLKSSALHLHWFQYYLIDIGLFLLAVTTLFLVILTVSIRKAFRTLIARLASPGKVKSS